MYASAREFFDAAREAARDAQRIARQLDGMERRALALGGGGFEPRVRSTPDPDRIGRAVGAMVDNEGVLLQRQEADYALIDAACAVLYGPDNRSGLYALVGWPADAIYHHYLGLRTWEETADLMGYSTRYVQRSVAWALDYADAAGDTMTRLGLGFAADAAPGPRERDANKEGTDGEQTDPRAAGGAGAHGAGAAGAH